MKKLSLSIVFLCLISTLCQAQQQTPDGEGISQVTALKRLSKKAKYGAALMEQEYEFKTGKGIANTPIVVAKETGKVELVSMENNVPVGFLLPYNGFIKIDDYDFQIYYKNNFKSQKYAPERVSLTDDNIYLDDNFGMYYGFKAQESGQRSRFLYDYTYTDAKYLTRIFFHSGIPVSKRIVRFKVPNWLTLDLAEKNFGPNFRIKKETRKEKDYVIYTFTADNLTPVKSEPNSLARPYYLPHLVITVRSFTINKETYNGFKGVGDLYAWYNFLYKKADNKPEALKALVSQITSGKSTDEEKIKAMYYWVQDNIRYIAFEEGYAGFVPQSVQDVYKNKYGDCKGMANLLTEMMKLAGYDAHFAWIGTREIPYDHEEVQSMCVDNHAISVLYHKGKTYFLDGTEKYAPLGKNAYRIQGKSVLVEHGDTYKVEHVPQPVMDENLMLTTADLELKGDKIVGHVKLTFDGEAKNYFHNIYNGLPADKRKTFIQGLIELGSNNADASNVKTSDFKNRDIPLVIEGDIEFSNRVTMVDKLCYTSIDFVPARIVRVNPDADRQNPYDLDNVFLARDEIKLRLPANAKPQSLPQKFEASFQNNNLEAEYVVNGNTVTLKKTMVLNSPVILTTEFDNWKAFVGKIREFNRNNIAIKLP